MIKHLRAAWRLAQLAALGAAYLPAQTLIAGPLFHDHDTLSHLGMRAALRILGIHVAFNGAAKKSGGFYAVGPHPSYLDTFITGSLIKGPQIIKDDISHMPVIGVIGRQSGTIFIPQGGGKESLPKIHEPIVRAMNQNRNITVFPEGDIDDGRNLLPFKSGILSVLFNNLCSVPLSETNVKLTPLCLRLTHVNGEHVDRNPELQKNYMTYGLKGHDLGKHLINLLYVDSMKIEVTALPEMDPKNYGGYKEFTAALQTTIAGGIAGKPAF